MRSKVIQELHELIEVPLKNSNLYTNLGVSPPRALLLYGVTGTGKTFLIKSIAEKAGAELVSIELSGITAEQLLQLLKRHTSNPDKKLVVYLVMHNPEAIEKNVIAILCKVLDGETDIDLSNTVIAGSSVRPTLPPELRRPGRFDRELEIGLPNEIERYEIIINLAENIKISENVNYKELATFSSGFTPADLIQSFRTAARFTLRRLNELGNLDSISEETIMLEHVDLLKAIKDTKPTVFAEFGLVEPNVSWDDLGGQEKIKMALWENVIDPIIHKEYYQKAGVSGIKGVLLYGPPGNGKSTIAKAVATSINARFLYINSSDLIGISGGEKRLRQIFEIAREVQPTLIFLDEADSLIQKRETAKSEIIILINELLIQLDGMHGSNQVITIAATNFPEKIDDAVGRAGRLELKLLVSPPDREGRLSAFQQLVKKLEISNDIDFKKLAELTNPKENKRYSFADLKAIVRNAGILAVRETIADKKEVGEVMITMLHLIKSIENAVPSIQD